MLGKCECGAVELEATVAPKARFICHCTICQKVYGEPFADITALWNMQLRISLGADQLRYKHHSWFPSSVNRGVCRHCERPVLGRLNLPPLPVTLVPTQRWVDPTELPPPSGHIFYHSRVADISDELPKTSGLVGSELAATRYILSGLFG